MNISKDILIETLEEFQKKQNELPTLEYKIFKEGVLIYENI